MNPCLLPSPAELSLPVPSWRPGQDAALATSLASGRRFITLAAPTGIGKSLLPVAKHRLTGHRTLILTSTRALMEQYEREYGAAPIGLVGMRGTRNYPCLALDGRLGCDAGPCWDGEKCEHETGGCLFFDAWRRARSSPLVVSNYAFWFAYRQAPGRGGALGERDLLVCDEAHEIESSLCRAVGVELRGNRISLPYEGDQWTLPAWKSWAAEQLEGIDSDYSSLPAGTRKRDLRALREDLKRLAATPEDGTWAWDYEPGRLLRVEPLYPAGYAEQYLWRGAPRVLLLSATVRPQDARDLGITAEDMTWFECDSPFPPARRPVYWIETGVKLDWRTSQVNLAYWVSKMDQVADGLVSGSKGIIHSVSYHRARYLKDQSRHGQHMILHAPDDIGAAVEKFRRASPPAILVSPAVHTGWDFPMDQARWQFIAKVPFPDARFGIAAARCSIDKAYPTKQAIKKLVQMAGRIVRTSKDSGSTYIFDDAMRYLYPQNRMLFPRWFRAAYSRVHTGEDIPRPRW